MSRSSPKAAATAQRRPALFDRLEKEIGGYTASERAIASYILTNQQTLAFETAASMAEKVGVSAVTVGRFARALGYRHFKALKDELKAPASSTMPWLVGNELSRFIARSTQDKELERNLHSEFEALVAVHKLTETAAWKQATELLARSRTVHVAGFQTERGIGMLLANHLQFMRDGVRLVDTGAGNYADLFATGETDRCLVLIDIRRYSRQSYLVAKHAHEQGIPLIMLTDTFCDWAHRFTPNVLAVPTQTGMFWSSPVALVATANLLVNHVIRLIGTRVEKRLELLSQLHQNFTGYVGHSAPDRRRPRKPKAS